MVTSVGGRPRRQWPTGWFVKTEPARPAGRERQYRCHRENAAAGRRSGGGTAAGGAAARPPGARRGRRRGRRGCGSAAAGGASGVPRPRTIHGPARRTARGRALRAYASTGTGARQTPRPASRRCARHRAGATGAGRLLRPGPATAASAPAAARVRRRACRDSPDPGHRRVLLPRWQAQPVERAGVLRAPAYRRPPGRTGLSAVPTAGQGLTRGRTQCPHRDRRERPRGGTVLLCPRSRGPAARGARQPPPGCLCSRFPRHAEQLDAAVSFGGRTCRRDSAERHGPAHQHYMGIGFGGLVDVVDSVGGVTMCFVSPPMTPPTGLRPEKGCQTLSGGKALASSGPGTTSPARTCSGSRTSGCSSGHC